MIQVAIRRAIPCAVHATTHRLTVVPQSSSKIAHEILFHSTPTPIRWRERRLYTSAVHTRTCRCHSTDRAAHIIIITDVSTRIHNSFERSLESRMCVERPDGVNRQSHTSTRTRTRTHKHTHTHVHGTAAAFSIPIRATEAMYSPALPAICRRPLCVHYTVFFTFFYFCISFRSFVLFLLFIPFHSVHCMSHYYATHRLLSSFQAFLLLRCIIS